MSANNPTADERLDHSPVTFGKYGPMHNTPALTPSQIAEKDPSWLVWAYETVKNRKVCSACLYRSCKDDLKETEMNTEVARQLEEPPDLFADGLPNS